MENLDVTVGEKRLNVEYKMSVKEVLNLAYGKGNIENILAVKVNNQVRGLDEKLVLDSNILPLTYYDPDGYKIYMRTAKLILYLALKRVYKDLKIELCNTIDNSSYFICHNSLFTTDMEEKLNAEINKIIAENIDITKKTVSFEEAKAIFKAQNEIEKLENMQFKIKSDISMCFAGEYATTMYGVVATKTGMIKKVQVKKFRRGFVLIYSDKLDEKKISDIVKESPVYDVFEEFNDYAEVLNVQTVADLNEKIVNGTISEIIRISEELQDKKMSEIVSNITSSEDVKVVLISGPSSSGKTTFAKKLGTRLRGIGKKPLEISMDNYFKERVDTPKLENGQYDFETVEALDLELFNSHMRKLLVGDEIDMPEFNFYTGEKEYGKNLVKIDSDTIIILEGIHALNPLVTKSISDNMKYKIYIAPMTTLNMDEFSKVSTTDTRMLRRMVRDYRTRGHSIDGTLKMWDNIIKGEKKYIYPFISEANYIFNTSLIYELAALSVYVKPLLLQVSVTSPMYSETRRLYNFLNNFLTIDEREIPKNSLLREFIG